ncbi:MAG: hypothetical protein Q9179_000318 [Wetmoreana sp. 5 TL-2023]
MNVGPHFIERKIIDFQRSSYICPYCVARYSQEPKLWEHAKKVHWESLALPQGLDEGQVRKNLRQKAVEKAGQTPSGPQSDDRDSLKPNVGDEVGFGSPSILGSGATADVVIPENKIDDFGKLTIGKKSGRTEAIDAPANAVPGSNPLKRGPSESLDVERSESKGHATGHAGVAIRREKALSSGSLAVRDPDFIRDLPRSKAGVVLRHACGSAKRLYSPELDDTFGDTNIPRKDQNLDKPANVGFYNEPRPRDTNPDIPASDRKDLEPVYTARGKVTGHGSRMVAGGPPRHPDQAAEAKRDTDIEGPQPQMLLQPETRPISHAQLVVEVKGIYAGLVMVEHKCIEVDEKQSAAAMERDPGKRTELKDEQWQALIALHKQLLHEHHDFFLASQHPSASPALSRLAAKYTMPARMWRHGIHAFLEVLRHRLPGSLDHMLAFIYIAYSMMALLYETVTAFEDTWIECLGDLARYRMAIEDSSTGDREIWGGVARAWYNKAADKRPVVGLLDGKTFNNHRSKALEIAYIKAAGILFDRPQQTVAFEEVLETIRNGLLDGYIDRATASFKEQGIYIACAIIAALFGFGGTKSGHQIRRSIFWRAFMEVRKHRQKEAAINVQPPAIAAFSLDNDLKAEASPPSSPIDLQSPTAADTETSSLYIRMASDLAFTTLSIALKRHGDKNVFPFLHVMFVFLWNLAVVETALDYVRSFIPWIDICSFLNTLAKPENMTPAVMASAGFPRSDGQVERLLPEEMFMSGQLFALDYLPKPWLDKNTVDEEERMMEVPSMAAIRVERLLWLGVRIAEVCVL